MKHTLWILTLAGIAAWGGAYNIFLTRSIMVYGQVTLVEPRNWLISFEFAYSVLFVIIAVISVFYLGYKYQKTK